MTEKILSSNPDEKTRIVKLGTHEFEIPAHMSIADMAEVWQTHSDSLEAAAWSIVEFSPHFAYEIVDQWAKKHGYYLIHRDDYQSH